MWASGCCIDSLLFVHELGRVCEDMSDCEYPKGPVPYLITPGECTKHVEWLKTVFDAEVKGIHHTDDTKKEIMHCWLQLNGGPLYLADQCCMISEKLEEGELPKTAEGVKVPIGMTSPIFTHLQYPTEAAVDAVWRKALDNGATVRSELKEQFWGDKYGTFLDPMGFQWAVAATVKEYDGSHGAGKGTEEDTAKMKE